MKSQADKASDFQALHEAEPFLIPNPWDAGSAKVLARMGYKALATTSAGFAFTLGRLDGEVALDELCEHVAVLAEATDLPVSVDLEDGLGDPGVAITRVAEAGAVGASIEDWGADDGIRPLDVAVERLSSAVEAARRLDFPFMLTARAENHFRGNPDVGDTIARLTAYEEAGADVVYAPWLKDASEIRAVAEGTSRPLNVLAHPGLGLTFAELADAGAQRVSVGAWLAFTALGGFARAAERMRDDGDFSGLGDARHPREWLAD